MNRVEAFKKFILREPIQQEKENPPNSFSLRDEIPKVKTQPGESIKTNEQKEEVKIFHHPRDERSQLKDKIFNVNDIPTKIYWANVGALIFAGAMKIASGDTFFGAALAGAGGTALVMWSLKDRIYRLRKVFEVVIDTTAAGLIFAGIVKIALGDTIAGVLLETGACVAALDFLTKLTELGISKISKETNQT
jgi:hypothetical protein